MGNIPNYPDELPEPSQDELIMCKGKQYYCEDEAEGWYRC